MSKDFKDLRKATFAVGFGFTVGKAVGSFAEALFDGVMLGVTEYMAKHGNKTMQKVLKKQGIEVETESKDDKNKIKMGFHPGGEA